MVIAVKSLMICMRRSHCHAWRSILYMVKSANFPVSSPAQVSTSVHFRVSTAAGRVYAVDPGAGFQSLVGQPPRRHSEMQSPSKGPSDSLHAGISIGMCDSIGDPWRPQPTLI